MSLRCLLFFVAFASFSYLLSAQNNLIRQIDKQHLDFTTDRLGNVYLINAYKITMYNKEGDSLREFNSRKYGEITYVDATDPYQILVFFKDYNLILFLDNFLSENGDAIDLQELGYDQVSFACQSREKGIWLFDLVRQKIIKLNEELQMTNESVNFAQWFNDGFEIIMMLEHNNQLHVQTSNGKVLIFDYFATFLKRLQINTVAELQILDNVIMYLKENQYCEFDLNFQSESCEDINFNMPLHLRKEKSRLYSSDENSLSVYKVN